MNARLAEPATWIVQTITQDDDATVTNRPFSTLDDAAVAFRQLGDANRHVSLMTYAPHGTGRYAARYKLVAQYNAPRDRDWVWCVVYEPEMFAPARRASDLTVQEMLSKI